MKLQENSVFANRYELQKLLGRGGFSEVWLAKDQWTHLNVAIKVYAPGQGMEEDGMNEFCGELAQVYDINHSNLLQPKHVDNWENMPYLIMAYCPNGSCAKLVGKATEEQMWRIIHDVASGLAYLHENDVVHQDIKPANILIGENGHYLITDFGVSSRARSTLRKSVVSSTGGGTTAYMGPERFSSQPAPTKASDIWSFGAMCFELIEGDVPFGELGGGFQKSGADIPMINANVSDALKFVIAKMLQKETWDRPTAATLMDWAAAPQCIKIENTLQGDAARHVSTDRPTERRNNAPVAEPEVRETARQNAPVSKKEKDNPANKNKKVIWVLVGVVAILIGVVCWFVFGNKNSNNTGEEPIIAATDTMPVRDTVVVKTDTVTIQQKEEVKKESSKKQNDAKQETQPQAKKSRGGDTQSFTVNGVTFKMIKVVGGTFQMGSNDSEAFRDEKPVHSVTLSDYYIGETEVTQALWVAVMGNNPSDHKGDNLPVEQVSWNDCKDFIRKLNQLTGRQFSLPTEAQWEFAARGGNKSRGYKYSGSNTIGKVAWYDGNSSRQTRPVGTKQANELGIYDMSGNVYEWCQDWYGTYNNYSETNPTGPSSGSRRVNRGGCWFHFARGCRSAFRNSDSLDDWYNFYGLRLALLP